MVGTMTWVGLDVAVGIDFDLDLEDQPAAQPCRGGDAETRN